VSSAFVVFCSTGEGEGSVGVGVTEMCQAMPGVGGVIGEIDGAGEADAGVIDGEVVKGRSLSL
jgi:hypothetical protein